MRTGIILSLLTFMIIIFLAGRAGYLLDIQDVQAQLQIFRGSVLAFPIVIAAFCAGAFLGAPQYALIFLAVTLFGPVQGGFAAWIATLISGSLTFLAGKLLGRQYFQKLAGNRVQKLAEQVAARGFIGSMIVRLVPTAPFVVVNAAFAIGGVGFPKFLGGMALGIIPKIAIVTAALQGVAFATTGNLTLAGIFIVASILAVYSLYRFVRCRRRAQKPTL